MNILTSTDAEDFNRQLTEVFARGGRIVGGIKSIPKGDEKHDNCPYDYVTFVTYD